MDWDKFMAMQWMGIIGYTTLAAGLLVWKKWGRLQQQSLWTALTCLLLHIAAAILYGYVHEVWYGQADTFKLFESGLALHAIVWESPADFIRLLLLHGGGNMPTIAADPESFAFWQHSSSFTVVKLHALMAFLSGGYYYTHAVLMGWLSYAGVAYLYNRWLQKLPESNPMYVLPALMLFPSVLLYGAGLHKEAMVMLALVCIMAPLLPDGRIDTWRKAGSLLVGIWLLWMVKEFYLWSFVPGGLALAAIQLWDRKPWIWFATSIGLIAACTLLFHTLVPSLDPVRIMAERQEEFMALKGNTNVAQRQVENISTLLLAGLQGLINVWLRPWPGEWNSWRLALYGLENYLLLGLWCGILIKHIRHWIQQPIVLLLLSTTLFSALITGIVVPNLGAIARYKAPMELLMLLSILYVVSRRKQ